MIPHSLALGQILKEGLCLLRGVHLMSTEPSPAHSPACQSQLYYTAIGTALYNHLALYSQFHGQRKEVAQTILQKQNILIQGLS